MFHPFDVVVDGIVVESEEFEEIGEELVASRDVSGEGFARGGEREASVLFVFQKSVCV